MSGLVPECRIVGTSLDDLDDEGFRRLARAGCHEFCTRPVTKLMLLGEPHDGRVERMLAAVGLQGLGPRLPQQLSGGQLQRVVIARALMPKRGGPHCM